MVTRRQHKGLLKSKEEGGKVMEQVDHQHTCSYRARGEAEVQGKTNLKKDMF